MTTLFAVTSSQVLLAIASLAVGTWLVISLGRYLMNRSSNGLSQKYKDSEFKHTLRTRTKYPEVDVFRYSGTLTLAGLAITLCMVLFLISWTTYDEEVFVPTQDVTLDVDVTIEPPRTATPPPPPPPPPPPVIEEVPDELIMEEEEIDFMDQSIEAESVVEAPVEVEVKEVAAPPPPPPPVEEEEEIFKIVEDMPRFPGCEDQSMSKDEKTKCSTQQLYQFVYKHIKYPLVARENGIQGNVVVAFVVNRDGSVEKINILRDPGAGCGEEATRVLQLMIDKNIKWTPGKQRGKPVRVQFILPIKFALA